MGKADIELRGSTLREMVVELRGNGEGAAAKYAAASLSASTRRAYQSDLRIYLQAGGEWPPTLESLIAWIAHQGDAGLKRKTVRRRLHALASICDITGHEWPCHSRIDKRALDGAVREHVDEHRVARARPVLLHDLIAMVGTCDDSTTGVRDRALLLVGWCTSIRRSRLALVDWEHLDWREEGIALYVPRSKTDQEGAGRTIPIPKGNRERTCPVRALEELRARLSPTDTGPVFRPVGSGMKLNPRHLCGRQVARIIQMRAELAQVGDGVSGHSLRAGMATEASLRGIPSHRIRAITGHTSDAGLAPYLREGALFLDPVATKLGL